MPAYHQPQNSVGNHTYNVLFYDNIEYNPHFHRNYEIIYVLSGSMDCTVNGRTERANAGDFVFCLSNQIHSMSTPESSRVWIGVFSEDFIYEFKKHLSGRTGASFCFTCRKEVQEYVEENLINRETLDVFVIKSCLYALCSEYLRLVPLVKREDKDATLINEIADFVEENYKKGISLATLAEHLGYEYCYFSKMFGRLFSMSFCDYLNIYRFNAACELLQRGNMPITDICYESGFHSIRSFNEVFKRLGGMSPMEFRKG